MLCDYNRTIPLLAHTGCPYARPLSDGLFSRKQAACMRENCWTLFLHACVNWTSPTTDFRQSTRAAYDVLFKIYCTTTDR